MSPDMQKKKSLKYYDQIEQVQQSPFKVLFHLSCISVLISFHVVTVV